MGFGEGNPQEKDGWTKLFRELLYALMQIHLSSNEWRLLLAIYSETYGFKGRKETRWDRAKFLALTGMSDSSLTYALQGLTSKNIIRASDNNGAKMIVPVKKYHTWKVTPLPIIPHQPAKNVTFPAKNVTFPAKNVTSEGDQPIESQELANTERNRKETEKEKIPPKGQNPLFSKTDGESPENWKPKIPLPPPRKWLCPKCGKEMTSKFNDTDLCFECFRGLAIKELHLEPGDFEILIPRAEVELSGDEFENLKKNAARMALGVGKAGREG